MVKVFQSTPSVWRETYCPSSSGDSDHGFQSTPSVWRETGRLSGGMTDVSDFNPLPPCGGRRAAVLLTITTLRFQSTPSVWRETRRSASFMTCCWISIHSLRVEGDPYDTKKLAEITNFNPLPPCGGRRFVAGRPGVRRYFNPLPPCGGRRSPLVSMACRSTISIHSLRVEGDVAGDDLRDTVGNFNPLPPCGGRLPICLKPASLNDFNPLPPCGGRHYSTLAPMCQMDFNPLPPCGGRLHSTTSNPSGNYFNPLPPCGGRPDGVVGKDGADDFNPLPPCGGRPKQFPGLFQ